MKFKNKILSLCVAGVAATYAASASAAPIQWSSGAGGNDHYYEFVAISGTADWHVARAAALASTHLGQSGYLATVTSAAENAFISSISSLAGFLGGSDEASEGSWIWVDGPEAGSALTYTNWNPGEPNNCCGGEDYLHTNFGTLGGWNDIFNPSSGYTYGYFVEYDAPLSTEVAEPASLALFGLGLAGLGIARRRRTA